MPTEPALWNRVLGQRRVKHLLLRAMHAGRIPHAYLFTGSEGVGKDAMALELARVLHCERGGEEACGECASCTRIAVLQHPDVHLIVPLPVGKGEQSDDAPAARLTPDELRTVQEELRQKAANPYRRVSIPRATIIKINSIREIRRETSLSTFDGRKRVFIISQADRMGDEAANTLLKTLEEPPTDCLIILTTHRQDALLPTIRSRCQMIRFDPLSAEDLRTGLTEREAVAPETASLVARLANGSYTKALELLDAGALEERKEVVAFIRHALGTSPLQLSKDVDSLAEGRDRLRVERFLMLLMMWCRDALMLAHGGTIINTDQQEDLERFVRKFPRADLPGLIADVEDAISLVRRNVYIKLVLYQLSVLLKRRVHV